MPEIEPLPRVTYDLARIACEIGYVPPPLLSPSIFIDAGRFSRWRHAFSEPLLKRLDTFQTPTIYWLSAEEYASSESPFTDAEKRALRDRGGFFAFPRIIPERISEQGRPEASAAEAQLRECLAVEIFRRTAEIEFLLKELENTDPLRDYVDAFSLLVDRVPVISELAKAKASRRGLDDLKEDENDLVDSLLQRLLEEGRRMKFRLFGQATQSGAGLLTKGGVEPRETSASGFTAINETDIQLPDLLTDLQDKTQLTRQSLVKILTESRRLNDFKKNPQEFIELAAEAINRTKRLALVDGIRYHRIGDEHYYAQELFRQEELTGYLKNTVKTQKSVYEHVVYDSAGVEKRFAEELEANEAIKIYAKLPGWFKVPTPLGTYNPDWAILVEIDGEEKLYFVVETKGSSWWDDLRHKEGAKIACGIAHFAVLAQDKNPARYIKATSVDGLLKHEKPA